MTASRRPLCPRCQQQQLRTETPKIVYRLGLSVYAFTLYGHLRNMTSHDNPVCFAGVRTLSKATGISKSSIDRAKKDLSRPRPELDGVALITIRPSSTRDTDEIVIADIWAISNGRTAAYLSASRNANSAPKKCPAQGHPVLYLGQGVPLADTEGDEVSQAQPTKTGGCPTQSLPLPYSEELLLSGGSIARNRGLDSRETDEGETMAFSAVLSEQAFIESEASLRASDPSPVLELWDEEPEDIEAAEVVETPPMPSADALAIWGRIVAGALGREKSYSAAVTARMRTEAQSLLDAVGEADFTARCHAFIAPTGDPYWRANGYRWGIFHAQFDSIASGPSKAVGAAAAAAKAATSGDAVPITPPADSLSASPDSTVGAFDPDNPFPNDPDPTDFEFVNGKRVRYDRALLPSNLNHVELLEYNRRRTNREIGQYLEYMKAFEPYNPPLAKPVLVAPAKPVVQTNLTSGGASPWMN